MKSLEHLVVKGSTDTRGLVIAPAAFRQLFLQTNHTLVSGDAVKRDNSQTKVDSVYATIYGTVSYSFKRNGSVTSSEVNIWSNNYAIVGYRAFFKNFFGRLNEPRLINDLESDKI